jgi:hypothetical protein
VRGRGVEVHLGIAVPQPDQRPAADGEVGGRQAGRPGHDQEQPGPGGRRQQRVGAHEQRHALGKVVLDLRQGAGPPQLGEQAVGVGGQRGEPGRRRVLVSGPLAGEGVALALGDLGGARPRLEVPAVLADLDLDEALRLVPDLVVVGAEVSAPVQVAAVRRRDGLGLRGRAQQPGDRQRPGEGRDRHGRRRGGGRRGGGTGRRPAAVAAQGQPDAAEHGEGGDGGGHGDQPPGRAAPGPGRGQHARAQAG